MNTINDDVTLLYVNGKDGTALKYASKKLKNNKELMLTIIKHNISALRYLNEEIKNYEKLYWLL